jgi:lipopolysaccharide transport system permease protein
VKTSGNTNNTPFLTRGENADNAIETIRRARIAGQKGMASTRQTTVIEAGRGETQYWGDVWRYRELLYFLAWRDILVRYKQTIIGVAWAVVRPLLTTVVFTMVFGRIAKLSAPGAAPYALLVMAAMLPWQFFSTAMSEASNSLITNSNLISKVYFPRLVVPASAVVTSFVDLLITLGLMGLLMLWYGFAPDWRMLFLPGFILLAFSASFGVGLWLCALNVEYRDFRYIVPFIVQFGLYISPVGFTTSIVPEKWRLIYSLNPMVGVIDGFRWAMLRGETALNYSSILASVLVTAFVCLTGIWYFRRTEKTFADII